MATLSSRRTERGFTLVEMLTVVIIVGVLATLAVYGIRKYIFSAKTSEAVSMMTLIKAAEESFKDETYAYLDVSKDYTSLYPMTTPGTSKYAWETARTDDVAKNWKTLGVHTTSPVQYGYAVVAAPAGTALTEPSSQGLTTHTFGFAAGSDPTYAVLAKGDVNGNGKFSYVVSHSQSAEVYIENEGE